MAIYLEPKEAEYLRGLLQPIILNKTGEYWLADYILKEVESDQSIKQDQANCAHEEGTYTGEKTCCMKCGAFFEKGQSHSWTLNR